MKKINNLPYPGFLEFWVDKPIEEYSNFLYGTIPLLPLHIGFDPIASLIKYLLSCGLKPLIIFADSFVMLEKNESIDTFEYRKIVEYYKFFFELLGVSRSNIHLHSEAFRNPAYWNLTMDLGS